MALASSPVEPSLIGAVLSRRYVLKHEIGRGGMGAVYAAEPLGGGPRVAIKILHPYFLGDETVMTRFLEEGRTCMRLLHPNILRVHECLAAEDGSPYLVMDLLEGIPLSAYTKNGGRTALAHAIPIFQGMLSGLEAAHAFGVVHRDLKPGNVFLARTGGIFSVKLLDFGIAKVMDAAGGMGNKTSTGALLGTPAYMSPEQVKNAKDVDGRSDLWSVAVMFYEMLAGRVAFPAPTEYARLAAVISAKPTPIESIDPSLVPVAAFMERALEKDRERRFQTAAEMGAALAALVPTLSDQGTPLLETTQSNSVVAGGAVRDDPSVWSVVTDLMPPPSHEELDTPSATPHAVALRAAPVPGQFLAASDHNTLASPKRAAPGITTLPSNAPPPVVIVPESELALARERETHAPPEALPRERRVGWPLVGALLATALTVGFIVGYFVGTAR